MTDDTILAQVTDLPKMSLQEVKNYWIKIFKADPPPRSKKQFLIKKTQDVNPTPEKDSCITLFSCM